jgi:Asp-tRNA(Asn)/Glu-tRNA(Gln) amidotransferase A subunit family amidase
MNNFTLSDPNDSSVSLSYWFDLPVKEETDKAIQKFKNLKMGVYEYTLDQLQMGQLLMTFKQVVDNSHICMSACKKYSLDNYFGDTSRFEEDAPVKTFEKLFSSGLLSQFWKDDFSKSNVTNPYEHCTNKCINYDSFRVTFRNLIDQWFDKDNVDVILLPTRVQLPYVVNQPQPNSLPTFTSAACIAGYPALNMPLGYSSQDATAPDGLPIGIVMFSKPERIINLFKIAK